MNLADRVRKNKVRDIKDRFLPKRGVDYFTPEEISQMREHFIKNVIGDITPRKGVHYFDGRNGMDGSPGINGVNGKDGKPGRPGKDGKDGKDADEELIVKVLTKHFNSELKKMVSEIDVAKYLKTSPSTKEAIAKYGLTRLRHGGGDIVQYYDLSASLDGNTKVFTIPANRKVISITSSSVPFTFRPIIDYGTSGASKRTLTFTAGIDAPSMLAAGQTITLLYVV